MCETLWMFFDFSSRKSKRLRLEISDLIDCYSTAWFISSYYIGRKQAPQLQGQFLCEPCLNRRLLLYACPHGEWDCTIHFFNKRMKAGLPNVIEILHKCLPYAPRYRSEDGLAELVATRCRRRIRVGCRSRYDARWCGRGS